MQARRGSPLLTHPIAAGTIHDMIAEGLSAGLELVGGWLDLGGSAVRRVGTRVLDPLARLAGWGCAKRAAVGERPPADKPSPGETPPQSQVEEAKYYLGPAHEPAAG